MNPIKNKKNLEATIEEIKKQRQTSHHSKRTEHDQQLHEVFVPQ